MPERAPAALGTPGRRRRLAEIVRQHTEPDDEVILVIPGARTREGVHAMQGVIPHVSFRVPYTVLRALDQRIELRIVS